MSTLLRFSAGKAAGKAWAAEDDCDRLADDAPLPQTGKAIVSLRRWRSQHDELAASAATIGVRVENTEDILALWPELQGRPLIALEFPAAGDGRAYSQARLLRERCGYAGELRAVGDVLRDQLHFMYRCGFDALALRPDQNVESCLGAFADFSLAYQEPTAGLPNVRKLRQA